MKDNRSGNKSELFEGSDNKSSDVLLRGIIVPDEHDKDFNILSVMISGDDERDYPIARGGKGRELFELIREYVEVRGFIRDEGEDPPVLVVKDYEVLSEY